MTSDLLSQALRGAVEQLRLTDQGNRAGGYGAKFLDHGCRHAPSCLECPFPVCVEDDPYRPEFRGGARLTRSGYRSYQIECALRGGARVGVTARQFGVSTRTVARVKRGMRDGEDQAKYA